MTSFQLLCAAVFVGAALVTFRTQIAALVGKLGTKSSAPVVQQSIAVALVNDVLAVTQLRDKLSAEGCQDGVDACTTLLRVLVEYKEPSKGVV
jgi:hypothetical protein